jgi:mannose-6-phosphate isomerase-like protein (cupin superfamily)
MSEVRQILQDMSISFCQKIPDNFSLIVQIDIRPGPTSWHIIVDPKKQIKIGEGPHKKAQVIFSTTVETLRMIYEGRMTALTAAAQARPSDPVLLDFRLGDGVEWTSALKAQLFTFMQSFFNRSIPERVPLSENHARMVHGGHAIPLYYYPGFRSAWYLIKKGERLNELGDISPFPQAFIFISGKGFAKIGEKTMRVRAGEAYYIPPGSDHVVWTEGDNSLELIYLAWGEGA